MIQVTKNFTAIPDYLAKGGVDYRHHTIKKDLIDIYNDKCCYCEQKIEDFEVEHYRPQKAPRNKMPAHSGYPWLKLEWSNLLWSCSTCNAGPGGKHNKFPIGNATNRITSSSGNVANDVANSLFFLAEGALLIHPEIENPEDHLTVLPNGKLDPINNSAKGNATIDVCNLNRNRLRLDKRKCIIDALCKEILDELEKAKVIIVKWNIAITDYLDIAMIQLYSVFDKIKEGRRSTERFALLHRVFYQQFDQFIAVNMHTGILTPNDFKIVTAAFVEYKRSNP